MTEVIGTAIGVVAVVLPALVGIWLKYLKPYLDATVTPTINKVTSIDNAVNHGRMATVEQRLGVVEQDTGAIRAEMARRFDMIAEQHSFILDAIRNQKAS